MNVADIISKNAVLDNVQVSNKRELIQSLAEKMASLCGLDEYQSMDLLDLTGGNVKEALNMRNLNLSL